MKNALVGSYSLSCITIHILSTIHLDYVQHKENQNVIAIFNKEMNYINL